MLTVAHALDSESGRNCMEVGFLNAKDEFSVKAKWFVIHPDYKKDDISLHKAKRKDIALVELADSVSEERLGAVIPMIDFRRYRCNEVSSIPSPVVAGYANSTILRKAGLMWRPALIEWLGDCPYASVEEPNLYQLAYEGHSKGGNSGGPLFYWSEIRESYLLLGVLTAAVKMNFGSAFFEPVAKYADFIGYYTGILPGSGFASGAGEGFASGVMQASVEGGVQAWSLIECEDDTALLAGVAAAGGFLLTAATVIVVALVLYKVRKDHIKKYGKL